VRFPYGAAASIDVGRGDSVFVASRSGHLFHYVRDAQSWQSIDALTAIGNNETDDEASFDGEISCK
jgi:hypothetical protein